VELADAVRLRRYYAALARFRDQWRDPLTITLRGTRSDRIAAEMRERIEPSKRAITGKRLTESGPVPETPDAA
jgi:hypothetical protein